MALRIKRTAPPAELEAAVAAHAAAILSGDERARAAAVDGQAAGAAAAAMARIESLGPLAGCGVIARARLGHQWIVKLRISGRNDRTVTLQERWLRAEDGAGWKIVEIEDTDLRSPWQKSEQARAKIDG